MDSEIRRIRKARGMTLQQLSDKSGISLSALSEIENGHNEPRLSTLRLIANALGTTWKRLVK